MDPPPRAKRKTGILKKGEQRFQQHNKKVSFAKKVKFVSVRAVGRMRPVRRKDSDKTIWQKNIEELMHRQWADQASDEESLDALNPEYRDEEGDDGDWDEAQVGESSEVETGNNFRFEKDARVEAQGETW